MNYQNAIAAISARIAGEWDNPALVLVGPLLPDTLADVQRIAEMAATPAKARPQGAELVRKVLELSTAHLPAETADMIDSGRFPKVPAMVRDEGWLFSTPAAEDLAEASKEWPCEAFRLVMQRAVLFGCDWVLFDRDGLVIADLPLHEW